MNTSTYLNDTFINIISEFNPLFNDNDECYFLFSSITDIHLVFIGKGIIKDNQFNDGLHKTYYIECLEFIDDKTTIVNFINNRKYTFYKIDDKNTINKLGTNLYITEKTDKNFYHNNLFKIDCFFVRNTLFEIEKLRQNYLQIIHDILSNQLTEIKLFI